MSLNIVILTGRLGSDPTFAGTTTRVAKLSVATTWWTKDQNGEFVEHTEWNRVVVFGDATKSCDKMIKGDLVEVEGTLRTGKYTDKNGIERYTTEVIGKAKRISGTSGKATTPPPNTAEVPAQNTELPPSEDALPF